MKTKKKSKQKGRKKRKYQTGHAGIDFFIHQLIRHVGGEKNSDLLEEMITSTIKICRDEMGRGAIKIINAAMKEMRYGLKVFEPYSETRKVAIFGSARTSKNDLDYKIAKDFARRIVKKGWMVITGASSGIMHAGNEGAGRNNSFGVNIRLPFEQDANPVIAEDSKLVNFKYFFTRKLIFLRESHATILCPGGFGTHDEGFETLTLVQTGKADPRPIICLDRPGSSYWKDYKTFLSKQLVKRKLISPDDMDLMYFTHSAEDAVNHVTDFFKMYHSMRYIDNLLVMRIQRLLNKKELDYINTEFSDILKKGKIKQTVKPFDEEKDVPFTFHLPRLYFNFTRHHFARLRKFIDTLSSFEK